MYDIVPDFPSHGGERRIAMSARIAHDAVVGSMLRHIIVEGFETNLAVADVELQDASRSPQRSNLLRNPFSIVATGFTMQHDIETVARRTQRDRTPDAPTRSCDEHSAFHWITRGDAERAKSYTGTIPLE
jgi:hypothetical protein